VGDVGQAKAGLEGVDLGGGASCEDGVNVGDGSLDVCGAILGHVLPDGLEVLPEGPASKNREYSNRVSCGISLDIRDGFDNCRRSIAGSEQVRFTRRKARQFNADIVL
jgi:hypothetical protein